MSELPQPVIALIDDLVTIQGIEALVLAGSRAVGTHDKESDWDLGLYYRRDIDLTPLSVFGTVYGPGSWGRIMNGGAWLMIDGFRVDILLRDLETVEHWTNEAIQGKFEVDSLLGYIAGIPTYTLTAELASCRILFGEIPSVEYPSKLAGSAPSIWRFCRDFSLEYARKHAARGNLVGAIANGSRAIMEEAHAVMCERSSWVCNEKRLIESAGLDDIQTLLLRTPNTEPEMIQWIESVARQLGA